MARPKKPIEKPCAVCGTLLLASAMEARCKRVFTCQTSTALLEHGLPDGCRLQGQDDNEDLKTAVSILSTVSMINKGKMRQNTAVNRTNILKSYIDEVGGGEPSVKWYREKLKTYSANVLQGALAFLPYWKKEPLRLRSLASMAPIDKRLARTRERTNDHLADLLAGYVDSYYELMEFGFENGLYGDANPVKLVTLVRRVCTLENYLEWIYAQGHETLRNAGRSVFDHYVADKKLSPSSKHDISQFYDWVRKKHRFVPAIKYTQRGNSKRSTSFNVLNLKDSQETYQRICAHPEPRGRALSLLALLYAQKVAESIKLKRSNLEKDPQTQLWVITLSDADAFAIEPELSEALDQCMALADSFSNEKLQKDDGYLFPSKRYGHIHESTARTLIKEASGVLPNVLRRTAVINMYRSGQKTMGTVVLRDVLNVSSQTARRAIRMTGESVNSPIAKEEAEALRRAFLEDDS